MMETKNIFRDLLNNSLGWPAEGHLEPDPKQPGKFWCVNDVPEEELVRREFYEQCRTAVARWNYHPAVVQGEGDFSDGIEDFTQRPDEFIQEAEELLTRLFEVLNGCCNPPVETVVLAFLLVTQMDRNYPFYGFDQEQRQKFVLDIFYHELRVYRPAGAKVLQLTVRDDPPNGKADD